MKETVPADYSQRIRQLRLRFALTQTGIADLMGVSFASVNRWENGQTKPSLLAWKQIARAEVLGIEALSKDFSPLGKLPHTVANQKPNIYPDLTFRHWIFPPHLRLCALFLKVKA